MTSKKNIFVLILSILGLVLSLELCKIYYDANFNPYALGSFCSVNDLIDCDGVAKTSYSQFLGVPLCLWGVFLYLFIIFLLFAEKLSNLKLFKFAEVFKNPLAYIFCLSLLAFVISVSLACISIFEIHKICILCFATYFTDLAIALTAKDYSKSLLHEIKQSVYDFVAAIKIKKYAIAFCIVVIAFAGALAYTNTSKVLAPHIKSESFDFVDDKKIQNRDNTMGNMNAKIVIHEYIDYNCGSCFLLNLTTKRILSELDNVYLIQHNFPLDSECNKLITSGHEGSCKMARYALAAKKQGKYWQANKKLFEKTPKTEDEIIKLLSEIKGLDKQKLKEDANSEEIRKELADDIQSGLDKQIDATPTMIINMQKITGNMPYIDLKEKLIQYGATEKTSK